MWMEKIHFKWFFHGVDLIHKTNFFNTTAACFNSLLPIPFSHAPTFQSNEIDFITHEVWFDQKKYVEFYKSYGVLILLWAEAFFSYWK